MRAETGAGRGASRVYLMGVCFVVFGTAHFVYADFTTKMVPSFLPFRPQLTLLTGSIHVLTGLALVFGLRRRWAAMVEAAMMTGFILLVHGPRVAAAPHDRFEITGLFIAITLSAAVWSFGGLAGGRDGPSPRRNAGRPDRPAGVCPNLWRNSRLKRGPGLIPTASASLARSRSPLQSRSRAASSRSVVR